MLLQELSGELEKVKAEKEKAIKAVKTLKSNHDVRFNGPAC